MVDNLNFSFSWDCSYKSFEITSNCNTNAASKCSRTTLVKVAAKLYSVISEFIRCIVFIMPSHFVEITIDYIVLLSGCKSSGSFV